MCLCADVCACMFCGDISTFRYMSALVVVKLWWVCLWPYLCVGGCLWPSMCVGGCVCGHPCVLVGCVFVAIPVYWWVCLWPSLCIGCVCGHNYALVVCMLVGVLVVVPVYWVGVSMAISVCWPLGGHVSGYSCVLGGCGGEHPCVCVW